MTPTEKGGYNALPVRYEALDGERVFGYALGDGAALPGSAANYPRMIFRGQRDLRELGRAPWVTYALTRATTSASPDAVQGATELLQWSPDGSEYLFTTADRFDGSAGTPLKDRIYRNNRDGSLTDMTPGIPDDGDSFTFGARFQGATERLEWVLFTTKYSMDPDRPVAPGSCGFGQYDGCLYITNGQRTELVSVEPDTFGQPTGGDNGAVVGSMSTYGDGWQRQGALSADARWVVFTGAMTWSGNPFEDPAAWRQLYVRDRVAGTTVHVSRSAVTGLPAARQVYFQAAQLSGDEGEILFSTPDQLTDSAPNGGGLYSFNVSDGSLRYELPVSFRRMDMGVPATWCSGAQRPNECSGVLAVSDDLSRVYLATTSVCAPGDPDWGSVDSCVNGMAASGATNLYVVERTTRRARWLGRLAGDTESQRSLDGHVAPGTSVAARLSTETASTNYRVNRATPGNGSVFIFQAALAETASGTTGTAGQFHVWRYDARQPDRLQCVSCGKLPSATSGILARLNTPHIQPPMALTGMVHSVAPRWLSDDGETVFFNSAAGIVDRDVNGLTDPYIWRQGHGADLLSSGTGSSWSLFLDASRSGQSAYIATLERLARADRDHLIDVYSVREDPWLVVDESEPVCVGDSCRQPAPPETSAAGTGSSAVRGSGNPRATTPPSAYSVRRFIARGLTNSAMSRLAAGRPVALRVGVSHPGQVVARVWLERGGWRHLVGRSVRVARRAGTVTVPVRISRPAARWLARWQRQNGASRATVRLRAQVNVAGVTRSQGTRMAVRPVGGR